MHKINTLTHKINAAAADELSMVQVCVRVEEFKN